jgi:hypothetical protein
LQTEQFIMARYGVPFQMSPPIPQLFWIVSLGRSRATSQVGLAFDVHFVVGRYAKATCGLALVGTRGTPSIPEECALPVFTSGPQHSACRVATGRRIPIGIHIEVFA